MSFFNNLCRKLECIDDDSFILVGGDFNCIVDPKDNISGNLHPDSEIKTLNKLIDSSNLNDVWRCHHPDEYDYTWSNRSKSQARRIDYMLANDMYINSIVSCDIVDFVNCDHRGILIDYEVHKLERGPGHWKMNDSLLINIEYVRSINDLIHNFVDLHSIQHNALSHQIIWDTCKKRIKDYSISFGKKLAKDRKREENKIREKLIGTNKLLISDINNESIIQEVNELQNKLKCLEIAIDKGAQIRSKVQWAELGEKSTKFFLNLEKVRGRNKLMTQFKLPDGTILTNQNAIMNAQASFYEHLYCTQGDFDVDDLNSFISGLDIPKLSDEDRESCEGSITSG